MKTLLFLDDFRAPVDAIYTGNTIYYENWIVIRNYPEFVEYLRNNPLPDLISFDHDLADGHYHKNMQSGVLNYDAESFMKDSEKTGYHCAKFLIDLCIDLGYKLPEFLVHSMNPIGKENILGLLNNFKKFQDGQPK